MKYLLTGIIMCCITVAHAQNTFRAIIKNKENQLPLSAATVNWRSTNRSFSADSTGVIAINNIPHGLQTFVFSYVGFQPETFTYTFPLSLDTLQQILLEPAEEEENEVVVTATRTSRTIGNTPTRTEVISGEELDEKANMKPGDIRMMLSESTGIQTQQTSATSYSSSIRIQGLDGRYTQILRDGYPLYAGFSGGLSIMQIAPLDLMQVEVIKGSSSTLYGGGAIAGLINLVSKVPTKERELSFLGNGTSAGGLDLSGFYGQRFGNVGVTVYGSRNTGRPYDPASIGFTAIPKFERYTINPKLFLYGKNTTANLGLSYITEDRIGGSMDFIQKGTLGYFEENNTDRLTTHLGVARRFNDHLTMNFKNSYTRFKRMIAIPSYVFAGLQQSTFSELTLNSKHEKAEWILGANILTDDFGEERRSGSTLRNYHYNTLGIFVQNSWSPSNYFTVEMGLRGDYVRQYGFELLPKISAMYRITPKITARLGGGFGYKTPTVFNEESERYQLQNILPINFARTGNERSLGGNFDVNYRTKIGDVGFSINQLFFYTRLNQPLILTSTGSGNQEFTNANGHIDTKGGETNVKVTYGDFKLFVGYTYADVNNHFDNLKSSLPLTANHRLNNVLMYEVEDKWKLGLEAYYVSRQKLNDGSTGMPYWLTGFMVEKILEKVSVYVNFENFTDTRQTKFGAIYTGTLASPTFKDVYAPLEGFVVNGGIKIRL
jgi:outer membrane receptor for ferrienterochelin and colicins